MQNSNRCKNEHPRVQDDSCVLRRDAAVDARHSGDSHKRRDFLKLLDRLWKECLHRQTHDQWQQNDLDS